MIDKEELTRVVEGALEGTGCFAVEIKVSPSNEITVEIDSMESVDIDRCVELTRAIEAVFDRDVEDYELEVGSSGLTSPFKDIRQWRKNIGNPVEVLTRDGRKLRGELLAAEDDAFVLAQERKVRREGEKRPVLETFEERIPYADVKTACYHLEF